MLNQRILEEQMKESCYKKEKEREGKKGLEKKDVEKERKGYLYDFFFLLLKDGMCVEWVLLHLAIHRREKTPFSSYE